jgi:hypothetical protein
MLVLRGGVSGDAQVNLPSESAVQFDRDEVRLVTSRERKIKSRIEIRRADKKLRKVILIRRKLFVFRIMEIKNIYRFSRES